MEFDFKKKEVIQFIDLYNEIMSTIFNKLEGDGLDHRIIQPVISLILIHYNYSADIHLKEEIWENYERYNKLYQKLSPFMEKYRKE